MNHITSFILALVVLIGILLGCTPLSSTTKNTTPIQSETQLKLLDIYTIPYNYKFSESVVGGLSGIDYDPAKDLFYIISDDRSATGPSRFYTAQIEIRNNKIADLAFRSVHHLTNPQGKTFPSLKADPAHAADPESIRYNALKKNLIWTDEGDRATRNGVPVMRNPFVYEMDLQGNYQDSFALPPNMWMRENNAGPRVNGVFEGSTFDDSYTHLFVSAEEPIFEDGPRADVDYAGAPIRITKFDMATRQPVAQYAYLLDAVARVPFPRDAFRVNGVSEILWQNANQLLVMERSYSTGSMNCAVKIYAADLSKATNVLNLTSLKETETFAPATKKLVIDLNRLGRHIDNVEGISFGPRLSNGRQSLILIVDNNFQKLQQQQVFLFEIR